MSNILFDAATQVNCAKQKKNTWMCTQSDFKSDAFTLEMNEWMNECGVSTITDNVSISFFFLLLSFLYSCRIDVWRECENYIAPLKCVPAQRRSILENETRSLRFPRVMQSKAHTKKNRINILSPTRTHDIDVDASNNIEFISMFMFESIDCCFAVSHATFWTTLINTKRNIFLV